MSKVSSEDLASKLREIRDEFDGVPQTAFPAALSFAAATFVAAVGIAYIIGQKKAQRQTTVVEVRRT